MHTIIYIAAYIYMWCILPVIDIGFAAVQYIEWKLTPKSIKIERSIQAIHYWMDEDLYRKQFGYKWDPFNGYLNYNWLFPYQAMLNNFEGDCDKAATMYKWIVPGGRRYTIIFQDDKKLFGWFAHVVYAAEDKVYDQTQIYNVNIKRYKEVLYNKAVILPMPY